MIKIALLPFVAFAALLSQVSTVHAFSIHQPSHIITSNRSSPFEKYTATSQQHNDIFLRSPKRNTDVALNYSQDKRPDFQQESEKRGSVILAFTFLLCVWSFSIPVEMRRVHWCFTGKCAENRHFCHDCITFPEWYDQVKGYYANGGGVHFDFSIEEK